MHDHFKSLVVLIGFSLIVHAEDPSPDQLKAKPQWQRMLQGDDRITAAQLTKRMVELEKTADYESAIKTAEELFAFRSKIQGRDHQETVAVRSYIDSLRKIAKLEPENRRKWLQTLGTLNQARRLESEARYAEALPIRESFLEMHRKVLGDEHPYTAFAYQFLAQNLVSQGKYVVAEEFDRTALEIRRKILGEQNLETAGSYNNLGMNLQDQGRFAEASSLLQKSMEIHISILGEGYPASALSINNLAVNLQSRGHLAEAESLIRRALEIEQKIHGEKHRETATCIHNLAANLYLQGKTADAKRLFQSALEIRRDILGQHHSSTADSLAGVAMTLQSQGSLVEAEPLLVEALEIRRRALGEQNFRTAASYKLLAENWHQQGQFDKAELLFEKSLEINRLALGEDHPTTIDSYNKRSGSQLERGLRSEAEKTIRSAIPAYEASRIRMAKGIDRSNLQTFNPRFAYVCLLAPKDPKAAWEQQEMCLARGLIDQLSDNAPSRLTEEERKTQRMAQEQLEILNPQVAILVNRARKSKLDNQKLEELIRERQRLTEINLRLAVTESTRSVEPLERIQAALLPDAALIYWIDLIDPTGRAFSEHWACVVRSQGDPHWERLPGTGANGAWTRDDDELPQKLRDALIKNGSATELQTMTQKLHAQRIAPINKHLFGVTKLHTVPVRHNAHDRLRRGHSRLHDSRDL